MRNIAIAAGLVLVCVSLAMAQDKVAPPEVIAGSEIDTKNMTRTDAELITISAMIEKVDVENRLLTVKDSEGIVETIRVHPGVKRLAELKKGDTITMNYYQSVAFELREPTEEEKKNPGMLFGAVGKQDKSAPPGAGMVVSAHAITTIQKIDMKSAMVTLKGPEGNTAIVKAKDPKNLEKLKVGDTVAVTMTEGLAIGIEPAS